MCMIKALWKMWTQAWLAKPLSRHSLMFAVLCLRSSQVNGFLMKPRPTKPFWFTKVPNSLWEEEPKSLPPHFSSGFKIELKSPFINQAPPKALPIEVRFSQEVPQLCQEWGPWVHVNNHGKKRWIRIHQNRDVVSIPANRLNIDSLHPS